jgi:hypothetical protein
MLILTPIFNALTLLCVLSSCNITTPPGSLTWFRQSLSFKWYLKVKHPITALVVDSVYLIGGITLLLWARFHEFRQSLYTK